MKKDIVYHQFENVFFAAVQQWNDDFMENIWNIYLINDSDFMLQNLIIVSRASGIINGESKKTAVLRHGFEEIPPVSAVKIEMIDKSVLALDNEFLTTFFVDDKLFDKKFVFKANSINNNTLEEVPHLWINGIIVR